MKDILIRSLKKIHHSIPPQIRIIYMLVIDLARKFRYYILPLYIYEGEEKAGGAPLKIAYLGWDSRIAVYFSERFLKEKYYTHKKNMVLVWNVYKHFKKNREDCDLVIVETNNFTENFAAKREGFVLPRWFEMRIHTDEFNNKLKKSDVARRIRKHSLSYEKRYTIDDFRLFYHRMYIPFIKGRHRESAVLSDYKYLQRRFKNSGVHIGFIIKDGNPVAGSFTEIKDKNYRLTGMGVLDGRDDIMRMGVSGAIYYFEVRDCIEKGIESISIGGTSPFITDGLTQFKLSLGGQAEDIKFFIKQYEWFLFLKDSSALRNILKSNPFIHKINNHFYISVFVESAEYENKDDFIRFIKHTGCRNTKGTIINCLDNPEKIIKWIKEEGYQDIQVSRFNIEI
ncbi:MAG: hypothetical protein JSV22_09990 [Bacteroidales bacterium]|nr:MAG: hypothetical protein JSV22_09990 [Bacteroidales bacterium]